MRRRDFITLAGGTAVTRPLWAHAQQAKLPRIGFIALGSATDQVSIARIDAFRSGLRVLGYVEDKNILIDARWAEGRYERAPGAGQPTAPSQRRGPRDARDAGDSAAKKGTATVPIVMVTVSDAVGSGIVSSLARPGGNVTGLTFFNPELAAKRLELLKEAVPALTKAEVLERCESPERTSSSSNRASWSTSQSGSRAVPGA